MHGYDGSSGRRIPPIVMGHEAAGTVEAVGAGCDEVFRRATASPSIRRSTAASASIASAARSTCATTAQVIGVSCGDYRRHGAFAEYVVVPERIMYPLPENFSFDEAAMLEAVSVAIHGVKVSHVWAGKRRW